MSREKLTDEQRFQAVVEFLQGKASAEDICRRYGISQAYLYALRDRALEAIMKEMSGQNRNGQDKQLQLQIEDLKRIIAEQAICIDAFKKTMRSNPGR